LKVFLTGGTGFLGKNVARRLVAAGHQLRLLARAGSDVSQLPPGAEIVRGDVTDAGTLERGAEGCGALLHMAALVKVWVPDASEFDRVNVGGLQNALAAARHAGARLVYTSSFIAVGPTGPEPADESQVHDLRAFRNHYERTKALADVAAREAAAAGQDVGLLYPGVVYGPGELTEANIVVKMIRDHLTGRLPALVGPGDRLWSYAFADDVAGAHVAALQCGRAGERYFLGGENVTLTDLFARLERLTGVRAPRRHIPYGVASVLGRALHAWAELTGATPELTHDVVAVFREHWAYQSRKAEAELGYRRTALDDGLAQTLEWLRARDLVPAGCAS
jgi:nucleoside-diphosphate-sugar epimerase